MDLLGEAKYSKIIGFTIGEMGNYLKDQLN